MPLIQLRDVYKEYNLGHTAVHALRGVDLDIEGKEFVAVAGPSGSGKSTLLNLIATIDEPSSGTVTLEGQELSKLSDDQRTELRNRLIGFVFQRFNLVGVLTALENVMLPLELRGTSRREARERALTLLRDVGLIEFIGHRPDQLSGGQQQRVAIARALVTRPAVVIADEPTANLDSETSQHIIELMRSLNQQHHTTFLFSTHDDRLLSHVDRLIHITDGRIVQPAASGHKSRKSGSLILQRMGVAQ